MQDSNGQLPSEILDRAPPSDVDAEMKLVALLMRAPSELEDIGPLGRDDFHDRRLGLLWETLLTVPADVATDPALVEDWLRGVVDLEECGGTEFIGEVGSSMPQRKNARHYADIIRGYSRRRQIGQVGLDLFQGAYSETASLPDRLL